MSDIVERLRRAQSDFWSHDRIPAVQDAIAEIERLRTLLIRHDSAARSDQNVGIDSTWTEDFRQLVADTRAALGDEQTADQKLPPMCDDCGTNRADPPSKLCPGCQAYQEHQR